MVIRSRCCWASGSGTEHVHVEFDSDLIGSFLLLLPPGDMSEDPAAAV